MPKSVLIPFGNEFLALTAEEFEAARLRGRAAVPAAVTSSVAAIDRILDADGMEKETGIPATWFLEQARKGTVPHLRAGKYVRFRVAETISALQSSGRHSDGKSAPPAIRLAASRSK